MVCCVEPRTFKDDLGRRDNLLERFLAALGAGLQWVVSEGLVAFELDTTSFTTIRINWHLFFSLHTFHNNVRDYSAVDRAGQACDVPCYNFLI